MYYYTMVGRRIKQKQIQWQICMCRVEEVLKSTVLLSVTTPCDDSCHIRWWGSSRLRIINFQLMFCNSGKRRRRRERSFGFYTETSTVLHF